MNTQISGYLGLRRVVSHQSPEPLYTHSTVESTTSTNQEDGDLSYWEEIASILEGIPEATETVYREGLSTPFPLKFQKYLQ